MRVYLTVLGGIFELMECALQSAHCTFEMSNWNIHFYTIWFNNFASPTRAETKTVTMSIFCPEQFSARDKIAGNEHI
jgi:hypothetical protein